jgi:putative spermidine/putrescine transport system substrate-binding protein
MQRGRSSKQTFDDLSDAVEFGSKTMQGSIQEIGEPTQTTLGNSFYIKAGGMADRADNDTVDEERLRRSNWVQKITVALVSLMFCMLAVLIAVGSATYNEVANFETKAVTVYDSIGLPGYEGYNWADVVSDASDSKMYFWTYDTADYNSWIDNWLTPRLLSLYNVQLIRVPINDTADAVDRVIAEYAAGYSTNNGSVDMIWINGENFATLKNLGYAYGPWATKVPNAVNFNFSAASIAYDFGLATKGYEMPYNEAQVVFVYNQGHLASSDVDSIDKLLTWIEAHPGKFTYAAPCYNSDCSLYDYTGSAFIRHVFYYIASPYTQFLGDFNEALYLQYAPAFYTRLRSIEKYLYNDTSFNGGHYPDSNDVVDSLFGAAKVLVTLSYDSNIVQNQIDLGIWNSSANSVVLTSGTLANTNYVLIPANAKHKLAAVVAGNFIASTQAMFSRQQPDVLGAQQPYDTTGTNFVDGGWNDAFAYIDRPSTTPSVSTLNQYAMTELTSDYITRIQQDWYVCVLNYDVSTSPSYCKS